MRKMVPFFQALIKGAFLIILVSCYKQHLYVQQEWVDENFLASTHVKTPDSRQTNPPEGQRLLVGWDFPQDLYKEGLTLQVTVRLWNQTEDVTFHPVERRKGYAAFYYPNPGNLQPLRLLTYRVQVLGAEERIIETWKHHFWTERIEFSK